MPKKVTRAPEVKHLLAALKIGMSRKGASSEEIVAAFKKNHARAITKESGDLVQIALMKLVGQVASGRPAGATGVQLELFNEYAIESEIVVVETKTGKKIHKDVMTLTLAEARDYVSGHMKPKDRISAKVTELARLLDDLDSYKTSESSTIGECWGALKAAERP